MSFKESLWRAPYLPVVTALILLLSFLAMRFSYSCYSDGCIGIVFPAGGALILLAIQILLCVPIFIILARRAGRPFLAASAAWVLLSVSCFAIPMLFVK